MFTKARIAGHPIHPMLVAFPIALYVATVVGLLAHIGTHDPFWYRVAMYSNFAAVGMALVAAIPGFIDLMTSVPARTRARATGFRHATFNVLALALFAVSGYMLYRNAGGNLNPAVGQYGLDTTAPLVLALAGIASTLVAGWLGWTMVQTHHVGIKPTRFDRVGVAPEDLDDLDEIPDQPEPPPATAGSYTVTSTSFRQ
ncbi:MAG TPA: DUF2231 domain-containing protein [Kofleriaceae bacterium]|nr:DUF2231 domain-containing protein [Kofleriaceae bacterium]